MKNTENTFDLKAISSETWPLGKPKLIDVTKTLSRPFYEHLFLYSYNAWIAFHSVCVKNRQKQLMFFIKRFVCQQTVSGQFVISSVGFTPALPKHCFKHRHIMRHSSMNSSHILYKEETDIQYGGVLYTEYVYPCSSKCKTYRLAVIVWKRQEKRIFEFKVKIGDSISTGILHNGFRLTVIPPSLKCKCKIAVTMERFRNAINEKHVLKENKISVMETRLGNLYLKR